MRNSILKLAILAFCGVVLSSFAQADIPDYVDFWAEQNAAGGPWTIHEDNPTLWNKYNYDLPIWVDVIQDPSGGPPYAMVPGLLHIDNQRMTTQVKHLWLEVHFNVAYTSDPLLWEVEAGLPDLPDLNPTIDYLGATYRYERDSENIITATIITYHWLIDPQPDWEEIAFYDREAYDETDPHVWIPARVGLFYSDGKEFPDITKIEVGTYCVPLPGSLFLCCFGAGLLGIVRRCKRS